MEKPMSAQEVPSIRSSSPAPSPPPLRNEIRKNQTISSRFMLLAYPGSLGDELNGKRQASIGISSRCAKAQCGQVMTELRMIPFMDDACCKA
jgi:hypothetical protein